MMKTNYHKAEQFEFAFTGEGVSPTVPEHIRQYLADYDFLSEKDFKCPICQEWFTEIDNLCPYHWEMCWCERCQLFPISAE